MRAPSGLDRSYGRCAWPWFGITSNQNVGTRATARVRDRMWAQKSSPKSDWGTTDGSRSRSRASPRASAPPQANDKACGAGYIESLQRLASAVVVITFEAGRVEQLRALPSERILPTGDGNGVRRSGCRSVGARVSCELPSWGLWGGSGGEAVGGVVPGAGAGRGVGRGAGGDFGGGSRRRCRRRPRPGWRPLPGSAKAVRTAPPRMGQPCPAGESTPIEFLLGREVRCLVELELLRTRAARLLQLPHEPPPQVHQTG